MGMIERFLNFLRGRFFGSLESPDPAESSIGEAVDWVSEPTDPSNGSGQDRDSGDSFSWSDDHTHNPTDPSNGSGQDRDSGDSFSWSDDHTHNLGSSQTPEGHHQSYLLYLAKSSRAAAESDLKHVTDNVGQTRFTYKEAASDARDAWQNLISRLEPQRTGFPDLTAKQTHYLDQRISENARKLERAGVTPDSPKGQEIARAWHQTFTNSQISSESPTPFGVQDYSASPSEIGAAFQEARAAQIRLDQARETVKEAERTDSVGLAPASPEQTLGPGSRGKYKDIPGWGRRISSLPMSSGNPVFVGNEATAMDNKNMSATPWTGNIERGPSDLSDADANTDVPDTTSPGSPTQYGNLDSREFWMIEAERRAESARELVVVANRHEERSAKVTKWLDQSESGQHPLRTSLEHVVTSSWDARRFADTAIRELESAAQDAHLLAQEINRTGGVSTERVTDVQRALRVADGLRDAAERRDRQAQRVWDSSDKERRSYNQKPKPTDSSTVGKQDHPHGMGALTSRREKPRGDDPRRPPHRHEHVPAAHPKR